MKTLTPKTLAALKTEGLFRDPETTGLYIQCTIKSSGDITRSWIYRFQLNGRSRSMGLGSCKVIDIAEARQMARDARRLVTLGDDPIEHRNAALEAKRQAALKEAASKMSFAECVQQYLAGGRLNKCKNDMHRQQFRSSLMLACAAFGEMNVAAIDGPVIIKFFSPIWNKTPTTARRTIDRVREVLDWAKVKQFRDGPNPADWKGNLQRVFTAATKSGSLDALPHKDVPAFMAWLRGRDGIAAKALEFTILTAARAGEVNGATWSEIDLEAQTWTVTAERMKAGKEHTVPLSSRAVELLKSLPCTDGLVFVGRNGRKLGHGAMLGVLREYHQTATVHGFRSAFRDWAGDQTSFDRETIEHALAHKIQNKVEAAYRRTTALNKRALLMGAWADYCSGAAQADNVVALHA